MKDKALQPFIDIFISKYLFGNEAGQIPVTPIWQVQKVKRVEETFIYDDLS